MKEEKQEGSKERRGLSLYECYSFAHGIHALFFFCQRSRALKLCDIIL